MSADSLNIAVVRTLVPRLSRIVALTGVAFMLTMPAAAHKKPTSLAQPTSLAAMP